jgi:hypothetical protein
MARRRNEYDDMDEEDRDWSRSAYDDDDDPDDDDLGDDDSGDENDDETIPCPHCRKPVYEDAEQCPYCGRYLSREDAPQDSKPFWIVATVVVILAAILFTWLF